MQLTVNGRKVSIDVDPERSLLSVLRDDLDLTGAKYGCGEGQCGACTVLLDGTAVRSCVAPMRTAAGKSITTIEGLAKNGRLDPVQEAFLETGALQCGYCTPGMILSAVALLRRNPRAGEREIVRHMDGNVCRCGVYPRIVAAVARVARAAGGVRS